MSRPSITFFPVGNGDCTLIRLADNTNILIDCNLTLDAESENSDVYDVRHHLLELLPRDDGVPYLDTFILTHPDEDHCRGFDRVFHRGKPENCTGSGEKPKIRVDELWFSPRVFKEYTKGLSNDARQFKNEVQRRKRLHQSLDSTSNNPGNRLRIVGYSDAEEVEGLDHLVIGPGLSTRMVNGSWRNEFELFVHGPFKWETDEGEHRNDTSIILHMTFGLSFEPQACLLLQGGDAEHRVWAKVLERTREARNTDRLEFDLFLAPHHCSWTFFNDTSQKDNPIPVDTSLELLDNGRDGALVVASSLPIEDNDKNPPHFEAAKQYKRKVGSTKFMSTAARKHKTKPAPTKFEVTRTGLVMVDAADAVALPTIDEATKAASTPTTYG